ncbi:DNA helicase RecQ [Candidatus Falkowbacteria bacterium]|nr:DNA helicase RecQ [Candidatus Falkowbacteria bacterium]
MKRLLKKYFGYDEFRPLQAEIIDNVLAGRDSFVLMPTGGGKSLCYQLPALHFPGLTLVVSPLIALMKDQVDALQANGIKAEFVNSSLTASRISEICAATARGEVKILYVAPERFALKSFQEFLAGLQVSLIAVDEAHCISEWGHDFRPDYRNLNQLKKMFPSVPLIALTATATARVREDIVNQLNLGKARLFISSFDRENLKISVVEKKQAFHKLVALLGAYKKESVIIYCFSRKETEEVAANLNLNGFNARAYHAGLEANDRKLAQELFIKDKVNIIVATIAFGMGIDKPDVRLVVHYSFPKTLEGYYQEIGRAGRDGLQSECVLFYTYADARKHEFFINELEDEKLAERAREKLAQVLEYCELVTCRKKYLLRYFGEEMPSDNCGSCDTCTTERERFDATIIAQKILSAVVRTDNRFGKKYIAEVLLGRKNQKILMNKHDGLSVFGIVNDYSEHELGQLIAQLLALGYLAKSDGMYPVLSVTKKGSNLFGGQEQLVLAKPEADRVTPKAGKKGNVDYDAELFDDLRALRKALAEEANVPPFVIFGDASLREMASYFPQDEAGFSRIVGVGARKLEQFADDFLKIIRRHVRDRGLKPAEKPGKAKKEEPVIKTIRQPQFYAKTRELVIKKIPLERIAKNQNLDPGTVVNHIEKMIDAGEHLDLEYLKLPRHRYIAMKQGFAECGDERLKPVYEHLKGEYSYDELKLARLLIRL